MRCTKKIYIYNWCGTTFCFCSLVPLHKLVLCAVLRNCRHSEYFLFIKNEIDYHICSWSLSYFIENDGKNTGLTGIVTKLLNLISQISEICRFHSFTRFWSMIKISVIIIIFLATDFKDAFIHYCKEEMHYIDLGIMCVIIVISR